MASNIDATSRSTKDTLIESLVDLHRYNDRFAAGRPRAAAQFGMRLDLLPRIARLPASHPFRKRGLHAESLVRTALEVSRVRPRFAQKPCGARVRSNGAVTGGDCAHGGKTHCRPLGAATFPPLAKSRSLSDNSLRRHD